MRYEQVSSDSFIQKVRGLLLQKSGVCLLHSTRPYCAKGPNNRSSTHSFEARGVTHVSALLKAQAATGIKNAEHPVKVITIQARANATIQ